MGVNQGEIEVICGSMFCGKTEELIRRIRRAIIAKQNVLVFKHKLDDRYDAEGLNSHIGSKHEAILVRFADDILAYVTSDTTVVAIDEVQFFDDRIVSVVRELASRDIRIILAGLDLDFRGEPFGSMSALLCIAEEVTKLRAICSVCGMEASRTQRLVDGKPAYYESAQIQIGAAESYTAVCTRDHRVPHEESPQLELPFAYEIDQ